MALSVMAWTTWRMFFMAIYGAELPRTWAAKMARLLHCRAWTPGRAVGRSVRCTCTPFRVRWVGKAREPRAYFLSTAIFGNGRGKPKNPISQRLPLQAASMIAEVGAIAGVLPGGAVPSALWTPAHLGELRCRDWSPWRATCLVAVFGAHTGVHFGGAALTALRATRHFSGTRCCGGWYSRVSGLGVAAAA